jgi:hypothetical protein
MTKTSKRKLALFAAVVAVVGGGLAAVGALGQGTSRRVAHARAVRHVLSLRDLRTAAAYLGIPSTQLAAELQSGKSLTEIADATPGKSGAGVIDALAAGKRRRLQRLASTVTKRAAAEANQPGLLTPARRRGLTGEAAGLAAGRPARVEAGAAEYLGLSPTRLLDELRGRSLAQVAASTPGKSVEGLIAALLVSKRERVQSAVGNHRMTRGRAKAVEGRLLQRVETVINRRYGS